MTIGIIGLGLIGGSIALKLKKYDASIKITGFDKNSEHCSFALKSKMIDDIVAEIQDFTNVDIILLTTPVDVTYQLLPQLLDFIHPHQTIIDVGSTKEQLCKSIVNHPKRMQYVAFHPMWGTEWHGPQNATSESFEGKAAIICDKELSSRSCINQCLWLTEHLGMHPIFMTSKDHDIHTAYISHISHITSYALANTVLAKEKEEETIFQLASSGFSSTVRLAKSNSDMWIPIFKQNKENVLDVLNEHITQLRKFKSALEKENFDYLEELIVNANRIKGILK